MLFLMFYNGQLLFAPVQAGAGPSNPEKADNIYEFTAKDIDGNDVSLDKYK